MSLSAGTFVRINLRDREFEGALGVITEIRPTGIVDVYFGPHRDNYSLPERSSIFRPQELVEVPEPTPEEGATFIFGRSWHSLYALAKPMDLESVCSHRDCQAKVARRILVNTWGAVCEVDVCDAHASEWHGKCTDGFPYKK